jgi:transglutaminase-like putative cysteine protease
VNARRNVSLLIPIAISAALFAEVTGARGYAAFALLPGALALASARRLEWDTPAQVLLTIGCAGVAMISGVIFPPDGGIGSDELKPVYWTLGAGALLLSTLRLHLSTPLWGHAGTIGLGLLVFLACGSVNSGRTFTTLLVLQLATGFAALRWLGLGAGERAGLGRLGWRHAAATGLLVALAAGLTLTWANLLPRIYSAAYQAALAWIDHRPVTGFHDGPMPLGGLSGLLQSDEVVARVEGDVGEHLRGNAYALYVRGRWLPALDAGERSQRAAAIPVVDDGLPPGAAEVRFAKPDLDRFFLPPRPGVLQLSPTRVRVDRLGVARTVPDEHPELLRWLPGSARPFAPSAPDPADLTLPEALEDVLGELAAEWVGDSAAAGAEARLVALEARLEAGYVYSVDFSADPAAESNALIVAGRDPLLVFLLERREGHCEYFASAMTLLARAQGIPARLVTGYRVVERNPFGGYAIVRERHAHAWTEAYLDGRGWVTLDPSPLRGTSAAAAARTETLAGLLDYARVLWERRGAELLLVALVLGLAAVQVWRLVSGRGDEEAPEAESIPVPPDHIEALLGRLSASGLDRAEGETLEALSRRLHAAGATEPLPAPVLGEAGALLRRYAALRYGGIGNDAALRGDVERWLGAVAMAAR